MTPLKNLAFVTRDVNPLDIMAIKNKDASALLRNINIASYFGGTDFKLVMQMERLFMRDMLISLINRQKRRVSIHM